MSDETFRLTALDVRRYDFGTALRGYDRTRVDQFKEQVATELERLTRANQELDQKARNFVEQLRAFRDRDRALNDALISAQQLREETREAAQREADLIRREAQLEAERVVHEAQHEAQREVERLRGEIRRLEEEIASLDRAHRTYVAQLRLQAERQLAEIAASEASTLPPVVRRERLGDGASTAAAAARVDAEAAGAAGEDA
jgi:DivIVA domain-containing protein